MTSAWRRHGQTDHRRDLDAATGYQELLVPALMQEWAPRVAEAAGIRPGDRVLDVACGTGALTREAARRAGRTGAGDGHAMRDFRTASS